MTYTDETKRILEAVMSGDCCPDCSAPNGDRHFDECPQHPENMSQKAERLASEFEAYGRSQALEVITPSEPVDLYVGPRQVRWWNEPIRCTHTDRNVCPRCAELTDDEANAIREYISRLVSVRGADQ
jgi:hypothetical protein